MKERKIITIICPVYNASLYLSDAIFSVINQTNENWELLLIDDGSTDSSPLICDEFKARDKRIKVIHKRNAGQMIARIEGIKNSSGDYVIFLDSDDILYPEMIEVLLNRINENKNIDMYLFNAETFPKSEMNKVLPVVDKNMILNTNLEITEYIFGKQIFGYLWMYCFRKDLLDIAINNNKAFLDVRYTEDAAFIYSVIRLVDTLCLIPSCFYRYRENASSITHMLDNKDRKDRFLVFNYIYKNIFEKYACFNLENKMSLYISWAMFSYLEHIDNKDTFLEAFREMRNSFIFKIICKKTKSTNKRFNFYRFLMRLNLSSLLYKTTRISSKTYEKKD